MRETEDVKHVCDDICKMFRCPEKDADYTDMMADIRKLKSVQFSSPYFSSLLFDLLKAALEERESWFRKALHE